MTTWSDRLYNASEGCEYPKVRHWLRSKMMDERLTVEDRFWAIAIAGRMDAECNCDATDQQITDDMNALVSDGVARHGLDAAFVRQHFPGSQQ